MVRLFTACFFFVSSQCYSQEKFLVDSSSVSFQIRNAGIMVDGTFTGLEAEINFNPKKLKSSYIIASVEAGSVDTGIRIRNNHLRKEDYFHVNAHPRIIMQSNTFSKNGNDQFIGDFKIKLKGKEAPISIPFSFQKEGAYFVIKGNFEIDRNDFDVGGKSILMGDAVHVDIWLKLSEGK